MKMAPLLRAFARVPGMPKAILVHTGQHYDPMLNDRLFVDLELPHPDVNLEVGSGSHAVQTAEVMKRFEPLIDEYAPSGVIVVGDVNSTLACALVASKKDVAVVHVEAGLRSGDRSMPEEINRLLTDQISDLLYTTERSAHANLRREGIADDKVHFVGNLMIDSLLSALPKAPDPAALLRSNAVPWADALGDTGYAVVTLHRPSNVDEPDALRAVLEILRRVADAVPLVWPIHPRTRASIERHRVSELLAHERLWAVLGRRVRRLHGPRRGLAVWRPRPAGSGLLRVLVCRAARPAGGVPLFRRPA